MNRKTALVTGASRPLGLGFAVARHLAEQDHHVILTARDLRQADDRASELGCAGLSATALRLDLADRASIREAADHLARMFDHLDVLVNNACHGPDFRTRSALDVDLDALHASFEVDGFGCGALIRALLPLLRRAPAARIVNVSSVAAKQIGKPSVAVVFSPAHSMAKYSLNALTTTLAAALADMAIRVNAVDPGSIASRPGRGDGHDDRPAAEAARGVVWAATLGADGPSGGLFLDGLDARAVGAASP
jgi:NAD(P)-dependent dehydrogenase (short-subunit alcohol dehydrogenase family)